MFDNFLSVCKDVTKTARKIPQGEYLSEGAYKIFDQGKTYIGGYCNTADGLATDYPYIVFGDHTRVIKYIEEPCYIGADGVKLLKVHNNDFISKYVYYAMMANPVEHQGYSRHFKLLKESKIRKADKSMQIAIINELDKINQAISLKEFELNYINDLVKSRFIEMFGDPISNPLGWEKVALSDVAEIKIGPFGSLLHKEDYIEHGHPLVNPSHIIDSSIATDSKLTISDSKYAELSSYHLKAGDVVLGRRGEMGRCAVVKKDGMLCGTGSLIIRANKDVTSEFIQNIISFPTYKEYIEGMAIGQTMLNLNVPIVSNLQIIKPPLDVQKQYYDLVKLTDKSKFIVQKQIEDLQELLDSKMDEYFG